MTGTIPKNAGSTSPGAPKKARPLCGNPRRSFHFFGPSRSPLASHGWPGRFPGFTKVSVDRTETRIKRKVAGGLVARYEPDDSEPPPFLVSCRSQASQSFFSLRPRSSLRNRRSWRVLAGANRRDCLVRIPNCFCRSFHLSRNDGNASKIVARDPFASDNYSF